MTADSKLESKRLTDIRRIINEVLTEISPDMRVEHHIEVLREKEAGIQEGEGPSYVVEIYRLNAVTQINLWWLDTMRKELSKIGIIIQAIAAIPPSHMLTKVNAKSLLELFLMDSVADAKRQARFRQR